MATTPTGGGGGGGSVLKVFSGEVVVDVPLVETATKKYVVLGVSPWMETEWAVSRVESSVVELGYEPDVVPYLTWLSALTSVVHFTVASVCDTSTAIPLITGALGNLVLKDCCAETVVPTSLADWIL
jgi:hypothetical protein